jgi:hypothetical protein
VGDSDHHCSNAAFSTSIVFCEGILAGLTDFQGKAIVNAKAPCTANNLAVDARVIYVDNNIPQLPIAIHSLKVSLKVLKPYDAGNKGD